MTTLQQRFDSILKNLTTADGEPRPSFLIGVSGGVDSMTLATLFADSSIKPLFEVAHVNFSLRGDESDGDQALVQRWCRERGVTLHLQRFDTRKYARERGISIEMAARELRYDWFRGLLEERNLTFLAVAHNLGDNVETLLLNLLRGTGLKGACGMKPLSGNIFRPLLGESRADIESFAREKGIEWRTDSTNLDSEFSRNRLRNEVFPILEKINPSFLRSMEVSMQHFAQAEEVLDAEFEKRRASLTDIELLRNEPHRSYWLYRLLEGYGFNPTQIAEVERTLDDPQPGKLFHSDSFTLVRDRKCLKIYPKESAGTDSEEESPEEDVKIIERNPSFDPKALPSGTLCADAEKISLPLSERLWREGDRFTPLGMRGSRKISDFLTDLKMDREQKRRQRVIVDSEGKIVCVKGLRIDDRYRVTNSTKKIAIIS